jgi:hypothetical protein
MPVAAQKRPESKLVFARFVIANKRILHSASEHRRTAGIV